MQRRRAILVFSVVLYSVLNLGCGPKCPEAKSKIAKADLEKDDVARVNEFVARRKALMESGDGKGADSFALQRTQFSVTAYELAIQIQLRIINLAKYSDLYQDNLKTINETRCFLDSVIKGKLLKKNDKMISDNVGKDVQEKHTLFEHLFVDEGAPSKYELKDIFKNGVILESGSKKTETDDDFSQSDEKSDEGKDAAKESVEEQENDNKEENQEGKKDKSDSDVDIFK